MEHRHLTTSHWTAAAVDSALERGGLPNWRELFSAVRADREWAALVRHGAHLEIIGGCLGGLKSESGGVRRFPPLWMERTKNARKSFPFPHLLTLQSKAVPSTALQTKRPVEPD